MASRGLQVARTGADVVLERGRAAVSVTCHAATIAMGTCPELSR
jgi:hypothetical protein